MEPIFGSIVLTGFLWLGFYYLKFSNKRSEGEQQALQQTLSKATHAVHVLPV